MTFSELAQRTEALALAVGARVTSAVLLLGCVLVIVIGAQGMLGSLHAMDHDIKALNEEMAVANAGLDILNTTMDSLPPTRAHLHDVVATVEGTSAEVARSNRALGGMATTTNRLVNRMGSISSSTVAMRESMQGVASGTQTMGATVNDLNHKIDPLVSTQHAMLTQTARMERGLGAMNGSLAFVIRTLNYIAAPPTGGPFTVRADLPKETLPPIPGIKATTDPIPVFPRFPWKVYTGP